MITVADLAHIADIVAAIGIIGSMIFVGVQLRQNTRSVRSSALQQNTDHWQNYYAFLADPKFAATFAKGSAGHDLEQAEFNQFFLLCRALLMGMENQHYQFQQGLIDKEAYAGFQVVMKEQIAAFPGIRAMWQLTRHCYSADFGRFLDQIVAAAPIHQQSTYKKWKELVATHRDLTS
jgi:hypothetical protein